MRSSSSSFCLLSGRYCNLRQSLSRKPRNTEVLSKDRPDIGLARIPERVVSEKAAKRALVEGYFEDLAGKS